MGQLLKQLKDAVVLMVRTQPQEDELTTATDLKQLFDATIVEARGSISTEWLFLEM
jgi:hypothetical protein